MGRAVIPDGAVLTAHHRVVWHRAAMFVVLTLALAALASSEVLHTALIDVLAAGEALIVQRPILGALLFILLAAVSAMLALVSIAVVLPVAVFTWGVPLSIFLLWTGWMLGGACSYALGRYLGRAGARWLTSEATLHRLENHVGPGTPFGLVLLFQFAIPSEICGYVLGLVRYRFAKYLLALAIVELVFAIVMVNLGASFVARRAGLVLGLGIALVLFSVAAIYGLRKKLR